MKLKEFGQKAKKYFFNILIAVDQLYNTLRFGSPDETVSSRLGRLKQSHGGKIPWTRPWDKTMDWFLDKVDKNHSIEAIEPADRHEDEIFL